MRRWTGALWVSYGLLAWSAVLALGGDVEPLETGGDAALSILAAAILMVAVPYRWARSLEPTRSAALARLGWTWRWPAMPIGLAAGVLLFAATSGDPGHLGGEAWISALYGVAAAVVEELFFRGHLQGRIGWGQVVVFAVLHADGTLAALVVPLLAGIVLTVLARRSLSASIACHAAFNLLAALRAA